MTSDTPPPPIDVAAALARPEAYPDAPSKVELIETHISWVFLTERHVYKVKKSVDLGFLDFTTLDRRRHFCGEEVRLNAALAPGIHLGVEPIVRDGGGLLVGGEGEPVEYAVKMVRLPASRMLDHLLGRGEVDNELLERLARRLADFHAGAEAGPDVARFGEPDAVAYNARENFEQLDPFTSDHADGFLATALLTAVRGETESFLTERTPLLRARLDGGRIRDGHGDLHAGNICVLDDRLLIYDRIEFTPRFRAGDVACDLAFLAMDLDCRGFRAFSQLLVRRYSEHAGDSQLIELLDFYKTYRAMVRTKVSAMRAADLERGGEAREQAVAESMRYLALAASYGMKPHLLLLCGLPGSGKSYTAAGLAHAIGAVHLQSDVVRKRKFGVPATRRVPASMVDEVYGGKTSDWTYQTLLDHARSDLLHRRTVVVDAVFPSRERRAPFRELARSLGVALRVVEVRCDESVVHERLERRAAGETTVSDADLAVFLSTQRRFEPPDELADGEHVVVDGTMTIERQVSRILEGVSR